MMNLKLSRLLLFAFLLGIQDLHSQTRAEASYTVQNIAMPHGLMAEASALAHTIVVPAA